MRLNNEFVIGPYIVAAAMGSLVMARTAVQVDNMLTSESDLDADGTVDGRCTYDPPCPREVHRDVDQRCPEPACIDF
jgi:isopropylmalate/homocitrate/citramalate synthase